MKIIKRKIKGKYINYIYKTIEDMLLDIINNNR